MIIRSLPFVNFFRFFTLTHFRMTEERQSSFSFQIQWTFVSRSENFLNSSIRSDQIGEDVRHTSTFMEISPLALLSIFIKHGIVHAGTVGTNSLFKFTLRHSLQRDLLGLGLSSSSPPCISSAHFLRSIETNWEARTFAVTLNKVKSNKSRHFSLF